MLLSKNQLKKLTAYRLQKNCDADGLFVVEGDKMCGEALVSGFTIRVVCATPDWFATNTDSLPSGCDCFEVDTPALERLSNLRTPNKVWMLLERNSPRPVKECLPLTLALDSLQDPGNMGTIMRIADWFGIRNIVCTPSTVSCFNPKVVQSSMGSIFRTNIAYCNLCDWLSQAQADGIHTYAAMLDGESLYSAHLQMPAVLVIGNEGNGISLPVLSMVRHRLTIPNIGASCESLNAATATAILCSEFARL